MDCEITSAVRTRAEGTDLKGRDETPQQIAERIRALSTGVADEADAQAIREYADWIERSSAGGKMPAAPAAKIPDDEAGAPGTR